MFKHTMQELLKNFFIENSIKSKLKISKILGHTLGSALSFQFCDVVELAIFHNLI
jgi:hypothetical protein